jgi:hypothetical protein
MRIEGHRDRLASDGVRAFGHAPHHRLVRHVHAVKVANAYHGGPQLRGHFGMMAEDLHRRSRS